MRRIAILAACLLSSVSLDAQVAPEWMSKFAVHGYVNQAYAVSDDYPIFGIPTDGTTDYRDLALQFRYDPSRRNSVVVQFRHERLGDATRDDDGVELAWAFYQHDFSDRLSLKGGRIPLPLGIFNEAGGAAHTSPFFRPANEFYDRRYTSKTIEGVLGSVSLGDPAGWSFDVDGYFGRWVLDQWYSDEQADAENAFGGQIWANTPLTGVRLGAGAYRCDVEPTGGARTDYLMLHGSIDADLDRWRLAGEYLSGNLGPYGRYRALYGQVGYDLTKRVSVHARGSVARIEIPSNGHLLERNVNKDLGLSLNFAIHPSLLFKLEGHTNDGILREDRPVNFYAPSSRTRYLIASVVATF